MDLEAALETQRIALLRLLSRWFAVVGFLSGGPFALALPYSLPRWICSYFDTLLIRAELAAQCLVQASVCLQSGRGDVVSAPPPVRRQTGDVPSLETLLRRMVALRNLLETLPRTALERTVSNEKPSPYDWRCHKPKADERGRPLLRQWFAPRLARPPDIRGLIGKTNGSKNSLPVSGREALAVG